MNKIYDHPGEFEFIAKSFTFDQSLCIWNEEKACFSIGKERENKSCRSQSHLNILIWKKTEFEFQKERANQIVLPFVNKIKSNKKEWNKLAVFEKTKKIDQEEQKSKPFSLAMSPKQLFYFQNIFSPKLKSHLKKLESSNDKTSEKYRKLNVQSLI